MITVLTTVGGKEVKGTLQYNVESDQQGPHLLIIYMYSATPEFGTTAIRKVADESIKTGLKIKLNAAYSSHIFHLYMGMKPSGSLQEFPLQDDERQVLNKLKAQDDFEPAPDEKECLIKLLREEFRGVYPKKKEFQWEDVLYHRELLIGMLDKVHDTSIYFVTPLLNLLEGSIEAGRKHPDTSTLRAVPMEMSEEGHERWKTAIDNNSEFIPFRNFEHLHPFMTEQDRLRLNLILAIKAIEVRFDDAMPIEAVKAHAETLKNQCMALRSQGTQPFVERCIAKKLAIIEAAAQFRIATLSEENNETLSRSESVHSVSQPLAGETRFFSADKSGAKTPDHAASSTPSPAASGADGKRHLSSSYKERLQSVQNPDDVSRPERELNKGIDQVSQSKP
ncbi:hypothetical protein [Legionella sp. CNM-4043-24]|uniref:hypothetical protein n=1 Tax=Legionella sp. CNM-4043-24 TaxID=3421646 RepID=UPI00403ABE76